MLVSIVIPNRNSGVVLRRALDSLLSQKVDLEIIVSDCESTDESAAILTEYEPRLRTVARERDGGIYDGVNRGFARARGDVFGWLAADDELLPGALAEVVSHFEANPATGAITGACEWVFPDGTRRLHRPPADPWSVITRRNVIAQTSMFWRASVQREVSPIDISYPSAGDWDYWCRMRAANVRLDVSRELLSRSHFDGANVSSRLGSGFVEEASRILSAYATNGPAYAALYGFLYRHFDLPGAMDVPPSSGFARRAISAATWISLRTLLGRQVVENYNWHFASLQQRGLTWW